MKGYACFVFLVLLAFSQSKRVENGYSDGYVFLTVRNTKTGTEQEVCANYLQFRSQRISETAEKADSYGLGWWRKNNHNIKNATRICPLNDKSERRFPNQIVPLNYRIDDDGTECTRPFNEGTSSFRNATQFQVNQLIKHDASSALFLIERGRKFVTKWRDFLFADFYDPYVNTTLPTFFIYLDVFEKIVSKENAGEDLEFLFHRPTDSAFDLSMVFIWLLAMVCVTGGGAWAFVRHKAGKDKNPLQSSLNENDGPQTCCVRFANSLAIATLMIFLVAILMLGFYFRPLLVFVFNLLLMLFGSFSVYGCLQAFLSNFQCTKRLPCSTTVCSMFPELGCISHRPTVGKIILYTISFVLCLCWFIFRMTPYAFILLDLINITLCLHILKSLRLPSLKWISTLMLCMFTYDAIMVFVTPLWTKNGCSVMLEVATGIDCSASNNIGYPMPPIDANLPEKFPMLMQVMHFDPMMKCIDLEVEKGFQMTILGLGDIIIPGYLVTHCFTMNGFEEKARLIYGVVCVIGYGVGLIMTFIALTIMNMAQPALIYLVPATLFPICILALIRGEFQTIWHGVPDNEIKSIGEVGPLGIPESESETTNEV
ncbi:unnamed protein product [Auanema sp. JU1783]|nr:unnamed protein product [Auanema sp. JU1783]